MRYRHPFRSHPPRHDASNASFFYDACGRACGPRKAAQREAGLGGLVGAGGWGKRPYSEHDCVTYCILENIYFCLRCQIFAPGWSVARHPIHLRHPHNHFLISRLLIFSITYHCGLHAQDRLQSNSVRRSGRR